MEAKELMIGDWVGYLPTWKNEYGSIGRDGDPNDPIPFKVKMVCWDCVDLDDGEGGDFDADDISLYPIPLTCEILEKNGFEWRAYGVVLAGEDMALVQCGDYWKIKPNQDSNDTFCYIWYVHELQHALRLCGIEHEITL